jgi:hypothetical protein
MVTIAGRRLLLMFHVFGLIIYPLPIFSFIVFDEAYVTFVLSSSCICRHVVTACMYALAREFVPFSFSFLVLHDSPH